MGIGKLRIQLYAFLQFCDRIRKVILQLIGQSQVVVELGIVWCDRDSLLVLLDCRIKVGLLQIHRAEIVAIAAVFGSDGNCSLKLLDRFLRLRRLSQRKTEIVVRAWILRFSSRDYTKGFNRGRHIADSLREQSKASP